jgi:hypothetical protein
MRPYAFLRSILLLLVLAVPALLSAQFQPPTPEELQMTADPKAPGAVAVYLNVEEVTDDPLHYHSFYARIKVLQEKGKELATVEIPYFSTNNKVTDIKARTIHADGTIVPLEGKPEDILIAKIKTNQFSQKVFTLPSVQVGSILEYRYQIRYDDNYFSSPDWEIQHPFFVHKAHYAFTPFKAFLGGSQNQTSSYLIDEHGNAANSLIWWPVLPPGVQIKPDASGRFILDLTDIPPAPQEEWMPPIQSLLYHLHFYYKNAHGTQDFWISEAKRWSKEVDHFAEPTTSIRNAVSTLVAPADSELDKAKKLYTAVQALDNTNYSRKKDQVELKQLGLHVAKRAEDTWAQKSGSREDITLLYLAMLRAAGLKAFDMKIVNRDQGVFSPGYLEFSQLDDDIVVLISDGKDIILDPGEKMCPFRAVHWRHSSASGITQADGVPALSTSPVQPYTANTLLRSGDLTLDDSGNVSGQLRVVMSGQEAIRWRQAALENDLDEVKKRFDHWLQEIVPEGVDANVDHFLGLDDPEVNLLAIVKVSGALGTPTSKRLLIPGFFFETRGGHPFVDQAQRIEPIDMHYADQVSDQITYHFPPSLTVEGPPQDAKIAFPTHAVFATKSVSAAGQITIARQLTRGFTILKPEEYQGLRDFYQKIAAADQQQVVLTRTAAATAGN